MTTIQIVQFIKHFHIKIVFRTKTNLEPSFLTVRKNESTRDLINQNQSARNRENRPCKM